MIMSRLKLILTADELDRITISESDNMIRIRVDVHGLRCAQARRLINNIINIPRVGFHLMIIHGFNHGTAIKDMLSTDFENDHILNRAVDPFNKGVTRMQIAA